MVYKKIFITIFLVFFTNISVSNVVYDKKGLIITSIDINTYKELYELNYGTKINNSNALKDLVLISNLIKNLENNNKEFLKKVDSDILIQYENLTFKNLTVRNFYRFSKIRNEFIINYFQNNLTVEEIENLFFKLDNLDLPISKGECLIIEKVIDLKRNKNFIDNFYKNIKSNSNNFKVFVDGNEYNVCIDEQRYRSIERLIIDYIQTQTKKDFEFFVYDKAKN